MMDEKEVKKEQSEQGNVEILRINDLNAVTGGVDPYAAYKGQDNKKINQLIKEKI